MHSLYSSTDGGKFGLDGLDLTTWAWDAMAVITDARVWREEAEAKKDK